MTKEEKKLLRFSKIELVKTILSHQKEMRRLIEQQSLDAHKWNDLCNAKNNQMNRMLDLAEKQNSILEQFSNKIEDQSLLIVNCLLQIDNIQDINNRLN